MSISRREAHDVVQRLASPTDTTSDRAYRDVFRHLQRTTPFARTLYFPPPAREKDMVTAITTTTSSRRSASVLSSSSHHHCPSPATHKPPLDRRGVRAPPSVGVYLTPTNTTTNSITYNKRTPSHELQHQEHYSVAAPHIGDEAEVMYALQNLNLDVARDENPLVDPLTNGTTLCALINLLEQRPIVRYHRQPTSVLQTRENFFVAIEAMRRLLLTSGGGGQKTEIDTMLDDVVVDDLVQGNHTSLWPVALMFLRSYDSRIDEGSIRLHSRYTSTYPPHEMSVLESALCSWMAALPNLRWPWTMAASDEHAPSQSASVGPLNAPYVPPSPNAKMFRSSPSRSPTKNSSFPSSPMTSGAMSMPPQHPPPKHITCPHVFPYLQNGTLLAEITVCVLGIALRGITNNPRREAMCHKNIRVSLEPWTRLDGMSQIYVGHPSAVEAVYRGDKVFIMMMLEDMMRYHHRVPPRRAQPNGKEGPYVPAARRPAAATLSFSPETMRALSSTATPQAAERVRLVQQQQQQQPTGNNNNNNNSLLHSGRVQQQPQQQQPQQEEQEQQEPDNSTVRPRTVTPSTKKKTHHHHTHVDPAPVPIMYSNNNNNNTNWMDVDVHPYNLEPEDIEWVHATLRLPSDGPMDFSSGVVLVRLLKELERTKNSIVGVEMKPHTTAARRGNIRRVLDFCRLNKKLFLEYLFLEDHVLMNHGPAIASVLRGLRKVYRR